MDQSCSNHKKRCASPLLLHSLCWHLPAMFQMTNKLTSYNLMLQFLEPDVQYFPKPAAWCSRFLRAKEEPPIHTKGTPKIPNNTPNHQKHPKHPPKPHQNNSETVTPSHSHPQKKILQNNTIRNPHSATSPRSARTVAPHRPIGPGSWGIVALLRDSVFFLGGFKEIQKGTSVFVALFFSGGDGFF